MLAFMKVLVPMLAAALVGACAASSVSEIPSGRFAESATEPKTPDLGYDQQAVHKVALSVASMSDPTSKSYRIGARDNLDVTVFQVPDLSRSFQVSEVGTISFPLIGEVVAAGKTPREVEQELCERLGSRYLQNPQITVFVKDYFSQRVTVEGAVTKPGVLPMQGEMTLLQSVAAAGGFTDNASHTVLVFRQVNGKRMVAKYDVSSIRDGSADDPQLEAGDVIVVPDSQLKQGFGALLKMAVPLAYFMPYL